MSETITADHLNATHLGKRITINGKHGTVMSGKLKKSALTTPSCPVSRLTTSVKKTYPNHWGCCLLPNCFVFLSNPML